MKKGLLIDLKWGVVFTLALLLWMLIERVLEFHSSNIAKHGIITNFFMIPAIAIYVFALLDKRKNFYLGSMTFKEGFTTGLKVTLVITLLTPLSQYIAVEIISPNFFENIIKYTVESGIMSQEDAEANFNLKSYIIQSMIFAPIVGTITSAIVAIFTKRK